ncbi:MULTISPECIES: pyrroloquinoline quinone biosynthesis peptide chaperone PqqD [unclassified Ruegeria]|uniref:pyrroloquinoline quinone biosynthesis peptide chaperone PqqD n=1 Tax=unclassified Ruegeria TaxID=2625375 RepID=UPI001492AAF7|nr:MULTISPECIES: pyrroloquinoline quinone biosynthesis peptide chaperone PqqD [unclassified Ruegeria]NOC45663.1 pyrroloquinoline quinone biosynthesis peptide chaperone PqqD [Ruegeria sp. HKCCD7559]
MLAQEVPLLPRGVRIHFDSVREQWVLLAPERAVTLDQIGHAILSEVDGQRSFGQITARLSRQYNAPEEQIVEDSSGFLDALRARRFLDVI